MAATNYRYSVAGDFPGGEVNTTNLKAELLAAQEAAQVSWSFQRIDQAGDVLDIWFNDALSPADALFLDGGIAGPAGGLIAAHNSVPATPAPQPVTLSGLVETETGVLKIHSSPRPVGTKTYFSGRGDGSGVGNGTKLLFSLTAQDASKSIDVIYNQTVYVKDGFVHCIGAPFGARIDAEIYDPTGTTCLASMVRGAFLVSDTWYPFDTEDYGTLTAGYIFRLTVHNSSGADGEDAPAAFKVAARVEMYRANTV